MKYQPINGWTRDLMIKAIWQGNNGTKSIAYENVCRYRGPGGNKCAIGVFIPDDVYDSGYTEGMSATDLLDLFPGLKSYMPLADAIALDWLQRTHDHAGISDPRPLLEGWILENVEDGNDVKGDAT